MFEPMYTAILLIGVLLLAFRNQPISTRRRILNSTLLISTLYLSWTFVSKGIANDHFVKALSGQNIEYEKLIVSPTPLNSILWHGIAKSDKGYYFGTYSLLDNRENIDFQFEESANELLGRIEENRICKYYLEYTQDFPLVKLDEEGNVRIYAIKYGPMNYFGKLEFVNPLSLNMNALSDENVKIVYSKRRKGPVDDFGKLFERIKGI